MKSPGRRNFIRKTAAISALAFLDPVHLFSGKPEESQIDKWRAMKIDPVVS